MGLTASISNASAINIRKLVSIPVVSSPLDSSPFSAPAIQLTASQKTAAQDAIDNYQSLTKATQQGTDTINKYVKELSQLATQSESGDTTETKRAELQQKFQNLSAQLQQFLATDNYNGQILFTGKFSINAASDLGQYIFTGGDNDPTAQQATLSIPAILANLKTLSIDNVSDAANALTTLQGSSAPLINVGDQLNDFKATLQFASNTINGIPNTGPSITDVDTLNQAEQIATAANTGINTIQSLLSRLTGLATQATSNTISDSKRSFLNQEFSSLFSQINSVVSQGTFQGTNLLDGSLYYSIADTLKQYLLPNAHGSVKEADETLQIGSLNTSSLFSSGTPDILTQSDAKDALDAIFTASNLVADASQSVRNFTSALQYAKQSMLATKGDFSLSLLV